MTKSVLQDNMKDFRIVCDEKIELIDNISYFIKEWEESNLQFSNEIIKELEDKKENIIEDLKDDIKSSLDEDGIMDRKARYGDNSYFSNIEIQLDEIYSADEISDILVALENIINHGSSIKAARQKECREESTKQLNKSKEDLCLQIIEFYKQGFSTKDIEQIIGERYSIRQIQRVIKEYKEKEVGGV